MTQLRDQLKDVSSDSKRILDDASERAAKIYDISKDFVRENQTSVLIGLGAFCGIIGFFLGRTSKRD
jgi:hypothetical protein